ncbi:MAG: cytochrome C oxidase subunit IV family protein [Candidatus Krumholzibacteriia bacterium]
MSAESHSEMGPTRPLHDHVSADRSSGELHPHVVPLKQLLGVFVLLVGLTVATVAVTYVDLGDLNLWAALLIAGVKASLVCAIFMHLAFDRGTYALAFFASIAFVVLFIGVVLMDSSHYQPDVIEGYAPGIRQP